MKGFRQLAATRDRLGRIVLLPLAAAMLVSLLGCGGDSDGGTESETAAEAAAETARAAAIDRPPPRPLLEKGTLDVPIPGEDAVAHLAAGELPEGYPTDMPSPPDSEPKNSMFIPGQGGLVTFLSTASREAVSAHFKKALPDEGWEIEDTKDDEKRTIIQATKGSRKANVIIAPGGAGTEIAVAIQGG